MRISCVYAHILRKKAGKPKTHHFPSYSRAGGRNQQKSMIFEQPQRRSVLHESREPYPCHTYRNDAADFFTPSCNFEATHAQRCNSCRSGACPNVQIHYPCRPRRRQEPSKKLSHNHYPAKNQARPRCKLLSLPAKRSSDRDAGEKTRKSYHNRAMSPGPPKMVRVLSLIHI